MIKDTYEYSSYDPSTLTVVTNGKIYRLQYPDGKFLRKMKEYFMSVEYTPVDFLTISSAKEKIKELLQIKKNNTWVPVE